MSQRYLREISKRNLGSSPTWYHQIFVINQMPSKPSGTKNYMLPSTNVTLELRKVKFYIIFVAYPVKCQTLLTSVCMGACVLGAGGRWIWVFLLRKRVVGKEGDGRREENEKEEKDLSWILLFGWGTKRGWRDMGQGMFAF